MKPTFLIGAGKGRLLPVLNEYLTSLGIEPVVPNRKLVYTIPAENFDLKIALLRWDEIKNNYSKFDLITYGTDQWLEDGHKAMVGLRYFPQANSRISLLVPKHLESTPIEEILSTKTIATSYSQIAKEYLGISSSQIKKMTGSVEAAIELGWADAIFDVVGSGETAKANGLIERKSYLTLGAAIATCRSEKIPLLAHYGLINPLEKEHTIAFDGAAGSGRTTLAKHLVHHGLWSARPSVLVSPYNGDMGRSAESLFNQGQLMDWSTVVGMNHWRAPFGVNSVYDKTILTCLAHLIAENKPNEALQQVIKSWSPLPEIHFLCYTSPEESLTRIERKSGGQTNTSIEHIAKQKEQLNIAAHYLQEHSNSSIVSVDTSGTLEQTLNNIRSVLEQRKVIPSRVYN